MSRHYARRLVGELSLPDEASRLLKDAKYHREEVLDEVLRLCDQLHIEQPEQGLKLARVAPDLAKRLDPHQLKPELHLRSYAALGAAHRILSQYPESEAAYNQGLVLLDSCPPLAQIDFLWRYASLRRDQRRFDEALKIVDKGLMLFRVHGDLVRRRLYGLLLVARAQIFHDQGKNSEAAADLSESLNHFDPKEDKTYYYVALHNLAVALVDHVDLDALGAALSRLRTARKQLSYQPEHFARWKLRWLEGLANIRFGSSRHGERLLRRAREGLFKLKLPFEVAVISLDLAALLHLEGRMREVAHLAAETSQLFASLSVHREALAALTLWTDATQREAVTSDLLARLREQLTAMSSTLSAAP